MYYLSEVSVSNKKCCHLDNVWIFSFNEQSIQNIVTYDVTDDVKDMWIQIQEHMKKNQQNSNYQKQRIHTKYTYRSYL